MCWEVFSWTKNSYSQLIYRAYIKHTLDPDHETNSPMEINLSKIEHYNLDGDQHSDSLSSDEEKEL